MKVVILAGGLGTRLEEETDSRPKPMVEIGGRPILWHIMKLCTSSARMGHFGFQVVSRQRKWDTWGLRVKRELQSLRGWDPTPSKGCP